MASTSMHTRPMAATTTGMFSQNNEVVAPGGGPMVPAQSFGSRIQLQSPMSGGVSGFQQSAGFRVPAVGTNLSLSSTVLHSTSADTTSAGGAPRLGNNISVPAPSPPRFTAPTSLGNFSVGTRVQATPLASPVRLGVGLPAGNTLGIQGGAQTVTVHTVSSATAPVGSAPASAPVQRDVETRYTMPVDTGAGDAVPVEPQARATTTAASAGTAWTQSRAAQQASSTSASASPFGQHGPSTDPANAIPQHRISAVSLASRASRGSIRGAPTGSPLSVNGLPAGTSTSPSRGLLQSRVESRIEDLERENAELRRSNEDKDLEIGELRRLLVEARRAATPGGTAGVRGGVVRGGSPSPMSRGGGSVVKRRYGLGGARRQEQHMVEGTHQAAFSDDHFHADPQLDMQAGDDPHLDLNYDPNADFEQHQRQAANVFGGLGLPGAQQQQEPIYTCLHPDDPVDERLAEFCNTALRARYAVAHASGQGGMLASFPMFRRVNKGFYKYVGGNGSSGASAGKVKRGRAAPEKIVYLELKVINHKLMARTEDGWNHGKWGPVEKFVATYE